MGCAPSKAVTADDEEAKARSNEIDQNLRSDRIAQPRAVSMLLLGTGESGKSTILKQMKIVHQGGFSEADRKFYKEIVFSNVVQSMKTILQAMDELGISIGNPDNARHREYVVSLPANIHAPYLPPDIVTALDALRLDTGVEEAIFRNNEYQMNDSAPYYFESIQRLGQPEYIPTDQDILRSRVKTTGITEMSFTVSDRQPADLVYRVFDVGGQRSERRKWIHCFENLDAVIFMVALSEYDQVLREDETMNRMQESLVLFESICNSRWFVRTSMILFLNKMDLLADKLTRSPLEMYLKDYEGPTDFESAVAYFRKIFVKCNRTRDKQVYTHITCATDTRQIKFVLHAMHDILVKNHLRDIGFI